MEYKTEQEKFWSGEFGDQYISRNKSEKLFYSKVAMWARLLKSTHNVESIREMGCNIGLNLLAINQLQPSVALSAIEINETAIEEAKKLNIAEIYKNSVIQDLNLDPVDLTFTSGVLIHIHPDFLKYAYDNLVRQSKKYILIVEYYNPEPIAVPYRGYSNKMFKRDFAGDLMEKYDLKLIDYGFIYKRDNWAPQDDTNWFLLEK